MRNVHVFTETLEPVEDAEAVTGMLPNCDNGLFMLQR